MKKIFACLLALLCLCSFAWAEEAEEEPDIRKKNAAAMTLAAGAPQAASEAEAPETWSETAAYDAEPALAMGAASMETAETEYDAAEEPMPLPQATAMPTMPMSPYLSLTEREYTAVSLLCIKYLSTSSVYEIAERLNWCVRTDSSARRGMSSSFARPQVICVSKERL